MIYPCKLQFFLLSRPFPPWALRWSGGRVVGGPGAALPHHHRPPFVTGRPFLQSVSLPCNPPAHLPCHPPPALLCPALPFALPCSPHTLALLPACLLYIHFTHPLSLIHYILYIQRLVAAAVASHTILPFLYPPLSLFPPSLGLLRTQLHHRRTWCRLLDHLLTHVCQPPSRATGCLL